MTLFGDGMQFMPWIVDVVNIEKLMILKSMVLFKQCS